MLQWPRCSLATFLSRCDYAIHVWLNTVINITQSLGFSMSIYGSVAWREKRFTSEGASASRLVHCVSPQYEPLPSTQPLHHGTLAVIIGEGLAQCTYCRIYSFLILPSENAHRRRTKHLGSQLSDTERLSALILFLKHFISTDCQVLGLCSVAISRPVIIIRICVMIICLAKCSNKTVRNTLLLPVTIRLDEIDPTFLNVPFCSRHSVHGSYAQYFLAAL